MAPANSRWRLESQIQRKRPEGRRRTASPAEDAGVTSSESHNAISRLLKRPVSVSASQKRGNDAANPPKRSSRCMETLRQSGRDSREVMEVSIPWEPASRRSEEPG